MGPVLGVLQRKPMWKGPETGIILIDEERPPELVAERIKSPRPESTQLQWILKPKFTHSFTH